MNLIIKKHLWLWMLVLCSTAQAQITLEAALTEASEKNPDVQTAFFTRQNAELYQKNASGALLPVVWWDLTQNNQLANFRAVFINGTEQVRPEAWTHSIRTGPQFSWTIWGGRSAFWNYQKMKLDYEAATLQWKQQTAQVYAQVTTAYLELWMAQQTQILNASALKYAEEMERIADSRLKAGLGTLPDLNRAKAYRLTCLADVLRTRARMATAKTTLAGLLFRQDTTGLNPEDPFSNAEFWNVNQATTESVAPVVRIAQTRALAAEYMLKSKKLGMLPTLTLTGGMEYVYLKSNAGFSLFNRSIGGNLGFTMRWYILNKYQQQTDLGVAMNMAEIYRIDALRLENENRMALRRLAAEFDLMAAISQLTNEAYTLEQSTFAVSTEEYRVGRISYTDLETRSLSLRQKGHQALQDKVNMMMTLSNLFFVSGRYYTLAD